MKWGVLLGISFIVVCMALFEWPKIGRDQKKEKVAFISLTFAGWLLAGLLVFYPDMPSPTQLVDRIFKPLGRLLEK